MITLNLSKGYAKYTYTYFLYTYPKPPNQTDLKSVHYRTPLSHKRTH